MTIAFKRLDHDDNGFINLEVLKGKYKTSKSLEGKRDSKRQEEASEGLIEESRQMAGFLFCLKEDFSFILPPLKNWLNRI